MMMFINERQNWHDEVPPLVAVAVETPTDAITADTRISADPSGTFLSR